MNKWQRVTRRNPCKACGKSDWCLVTADGSYFCMRVESSRPKTLADGTLGWFHSVNGDAPPPPLLPRKPKEPAVDCRALMTRWYRATTRSKRSELAASLGLSESSLGEPRGVPAAWFADDGAWGFPMYDGLGHMIGIRLRYPSGKKLTVTGTHNGIFLPIGNPCSPAVIVEGPTDAAAAVQLGFYPIGRPSCSGGVPFIKNALRRLGFKEAIIIADNDEDPEEPERHNPGVSGAALLSQALTIPHCVLCLPCKDLRSFVQAGGTRADLNELRQESIWKVRQEP